MRSFTVRPIDPVGKAFKEAGIGFEFAEYLKGETHYIVVTIKKKSLLEHGVLRQVTGRHCDHSHHHHHPPHPHPPPHPPPPPPPGPPGQVAPHEGEPRRAVAPRALAQDRQRRRPPGDHRVLRLPPGETLRLLDARALPRGLPRARRPRGRRAAGRGGGAGPRGPRVPQGRRDEVVCARARGGGGAREGVEAGEAGARRRDQGAVEHDPGDARARRR